MKDRYTNTAKMLKALSDPKRLKIVDMLSRGELCACVILEEFHITQPTLSPSHIASKRSSTVYALFADADACKQ